MMNVNKLLLGTAFLTSCLAPTLGHAVDSAPALYGIQEIQVQNARLSNKDTTSQCGLSSGEIADAAVKTFRRDSFSVFSPINAPPLKEGTARIDLLPTVMSLQTDDKTCTSWVSLSAQSRNLVVLPPIETPRYVTITYWEGGMMAYSTTGTHAQAIVNAIDKISGQFSRQYKMDQPPSLTPPPEIKKP